MDLRKSLGRPIVESAAVTSLRIVVGVVFVVHGAMKLSNVDGTARLFGSVYNVPLPLLAVYLAVLAEFFGGLGLLVGFLTRLAALGTAVTMVFAIAFAHAGRGLLSKNGGWEFPLTLLCVSLFFIAHGGGAFSVDVLWRRLRVQRRRTLAAESGLEGRAGSDDFPSQAHRTPGP